MPGASRQGDDSAGGTIIEGSDDVIINGKGAVTIGDTVESHGDSPHDAATMVEGSDDVIVNGKGLVRAGDNATCGDPATGSDDVNVN